MGIFIIKAMMLKLGTEPFQGLGGELTMSWHGPLFFLNFQSHIFLYFFLERPVQNKIYPCGEVLYYQNTKRLRIRDVKWQLRWSRSGREAEGSRTEYPKMSPPLFLTKWSMVYRLTWRTNRDKVWKKTVSMKTSPFSISGTRIPFLFLHKSN